MNFTSMRILLIIFVCLQAYISRAQFWSTSSDDYSPYPIGLHADLGGLYVGGMARIAVEYPMQTIKMRTLTDRNHRQEILLQRLFTPSVSFALKPNGYQAYMADAGLLWRRKGERGFFLEYGIGVGLGYFSGQDSFIYSDNGRLPQGLFLLPSATIGFGSDLFLSSQEAKPWLWSLRLHIPCAFPSNNKLFPLPMVQLGLTRFFPEKWTRDQRYILRSRAKPR